MARRRDMRVLMVISQFYPFVGGAERQAQKLARALMNRGVEVTVLTAMRGPGQAKCEEIDGIQVRRHFARGIRIAGGERRHVYGYMLGLVHAMWKLRDSYDVVHVHQMIHGAFVAAHIGPAIGKPVIVKVGNTGERFDLKQFQQGHRFLGPWMIRSMIPKITRVVALCSESVKELREQGFVEGQIVRIPNGVELPDGGTETGWTGWKDRNGVRRGLGLGNEDTVIVFVGSLQPKKDVPSLLLAIAEMATAGQTKPGLLIIGDGPLRAELEGQARGLGIGDLTRFVGTVGDVRPYLAAGDIFALPSRVEGMSNALLEAMAHGLPCVATAVGGNTDVIQDGINGLLVPAGDPAAMAEALARLAYSTEMRSRLGSAGVETIRAGFTMDHVADRYVGLYEELVGSQGPGSGEPHFSSQDSNIRMSQR